MRTLARTAAALTLAIGLGACGGGSGGVAGGLPEPPAGAATGRTEDSGSGVTETASVDGTLDESFAVSLTSVDVRRRSTGERVPIEIIGVDSGELRIVLSATD